MEGPISLCKQDPRLADVIEGFYLETIDELFFAVKGLEHPQDRRIGVLRYAPDAACGDRKRGHRYYRRLYHFDEQEHFIETNCPQYLAFDPFFQKRLQGVPVSMVRTVLDPRRKFFELCEAPALSALENDARDFLIILQNEARIPQRALGVTGSLLTGLYTEKSDIDAVVYGTENCRKACRVLQKMLDGAKGGELQRLDRQGMEELFVQRSGDTRMEREDFMALERRKVNQGLFRKRMYFVRFVKEPKEFGDVYGQVRYTPVGRSVISASIAEDEESIFTPCRYPLLHVQFHEGPSVPDLREIVSFRGRFCEQAQKGETVTASGTLERLEYVQGGFRYRLLLGNSLDDGMRVIAS